MPTPSSPGPQPPYNVAATCPDPEEHHQQQQQTPRSPSDWHQIQPPRYDVNMDLSGDPAEGRGTPTEESLSRSTTTSPGPHLARSDGPLTDLEATTPLTVQSQESVDSQKLSEIDEEPADAPCEAIPAKSVQTSRPRHGVGTEELPNYNIHTATSTELRHGTEEDYAMPSMGYSFPSRRVCTPHPA